MHLKFLEQLKPFNIEDSALQNLILSAYNYNSFKSDSLLQNIQEKKAFSLLVRFFRSLNSNKKIDEESLILCLKDVFKNKQVSMSTIQDKINQIVAIQTTRVYFGNKIHNELNQLTERRLNYFNVKDDLTSISCNTCGFYNPVDFLSNNFHILTNFYFKLNIGISNKNSNRVLQPEIYLFLQISTGETICLNIDIKVFQEIRKCLAFHIKKILDVENKPLLK
jgi:hypothetical protein